jgi:hypothetical protein
MHLRVFSVKCGFTTYTLLLFPVLKSWQNFVILKTRIWQRNVVVLPPSTYSQQVSRLFIFHLITLTHTPQSVGLLWTRDRPVADTSTWQHKHSQETNIHAPGRIRTHNPSKRSAADLRLRRRGHWDRRQRNVVHKNSDWFVRYCDITG